MSIENNTPLIQSLYEAFGRGDLPYVLSKIHTDASWVMPGQGRIPHAGNYRGPSGAADFFTTFLSHLNITAFEPREFIAQGERVVVLGRESLQHKTNGRQCDVEWANIFTVHEGMVTSFQEITDTDAMARLFD